jgi:hypothetical protein
MIEARDIVICRDPRAPHWRIPTTIASSVAVIGWVERAANVEGGMPEWTADLVARALTAQHRMTFLSSLRFERRPEFLSEHVLSGVKALFGQGPRRFAMVSTRDPAVARRAFDDPGFPWWLQGQSVLIQAADAGELTLTADAALKMLSPEVDPSAWRHRGIVAELRPGVDGDIAALYSADIAVQTGLLASLQREAIHAGAHFEELAEEAFAAALASS